MRPMRCLCVGLAVLAGCGGGDNLPDQELIDDVRRRVEAVGTSLGAARTAFEVLGLMPDYTCDEPPSTWVSDAVAEVAGTLGCGNFTTSMVDENTHVIAIVFPGAGCEVMGHTIMGALGFTYVGGEDSMSLTVDFTQVVVDSEMIDATAGYERCGDQTSYWTMVAGDIDADRSFSIDATVTLRDGVPVIGGATLAVDGTASVTGFIGTDMVTMDALEWEVGDLLPQSGRLVIDTATGHHVEAVFDRSTPLGGEVVITIDDYDPVTVPVF